MAGKSLTSEQYHALASNGQLEWLGPEVPNGGELTWWECMLCHYRWQDCYHNLRRGGSCPDCQDLATKDCQTVPFNKWLVRNLADTRLSERESAAHQEEQAQLIENMLRCLDGKKQQVIIGRYGLRGSSLDQTQKAVAEQIGRSKSRVGQLEQRGLRKLERWVREQQLIPALEKMLPCLSVRDQELLDGYFRVVGWDELRQQRKRVAQRLDVTIEVVSRCQRRVLERLKTYCLKEAYLALLDCFGPRQPISFCRLTIQQVAAALSLRVTERPSR